MPAGLDGPGTRPARSRRWLAAAAWAGGSIALFALLLRISLGSRVDSDGANSALQAWDLLHGHLLLHGWDIGDATFYFFELPLNAITQAVFGLGNFAAHVASALTYLCVTVCAAALAAAGSRGPARAVRAAAVVMVLAAPLLTATSVPLFLEEPDHIGTSVFILGSFLLIDRAPGRRFTAPLLCVILCAGQFGDLTVRYVAVPAIAAVCGYRALAARRLRSPDAALAAAAVVSVPLEMLIRAVTVRLGGFWMPPPKARFAPAGLWAHHAAVTWLNLRDLFGAIDAPDTKFGALGAVFGLGCLLAVAVGLARVAWAWRRASRAEQMLGAAIVCNVGTYMVSVLALPANSHELVAVLPCGAVLAARTLVPARITWAPAAFGAVAVTALAAVLPLASAATRAVDVPVTASLTSWLEAHRLTYGLAGYWDASSATVQSGGRVKIRAVNLWKTIPVPGYSVQVPDYEMNTSWYDPSLHDASFVVADAYKRYPPAGFERAFGRPAATYRMAGWVILVYQANLLQLIAQGR